MYPLSAGFIPNLGKACPDLNFIFLLISFELFYQKILIFRCPCFMLNQWILVFCFSLLNHIYHLCTFCFSSLSSSGSALRLLYLWCLQLYYITCIWWAGWCWTSCSSVCAVVPGICYIGLVWVIPFGFILLFSCFKDLLTDLLFWSPI